MDFGRPEADREETMRFRPCIDIHNGKVKQIVGGSLEDAGDRARENFVAEQGAGFFAELYRKDGLEGGHVILLNPQGSPYYEEDKRQAAEALSVWPGGLQAGGGICPENAEEFLEMGASHVIVTSYVFRDGRICEERLDRMVRAVGRERLVLDLSCRKRDGVYYVVTDRWQKFTDEPLTAELLSHLAGSCAEFLIHGADVEGKAAGAEEELLKLLGSYRGNPVTYAGGIGTYGDLMKMRTLCRDRVDVTIGSALDLFGGPMEYRKILKLLK